MRKEINLLEGQIEKKAPTFEEMPQESAPLQNQLQDQLQSKIDAKTQAGNLAVEASPDLAVEASCDLEKSGEDKAENLATPSASEPDLFAQMLSQLKLPIAQKEKPRIAAAASEKKALDKELKKIVEALLFASETPLSFQKLREVIETFTPIKPKELRETLDEISAELEREDRPYRLIPIAQGFQLRSAPEYSCYIEQLFRNRRGEKLSPASLEVLAIIAYRQPITRAQIENIRGVDSSGVLHSLLERGLIETAGRLEAPGRPTLYSTAKDFLVHFGLKDLSDLPQPIV